MSEQAPFYIFTAFVLAYGTETLGFSNGFMTNSVMLAAALSLFSVPFFGHLSDRIGRRRTYLIGAGATLVWGVPYFLLLDPRSGPSWSWPSSSRSSRTTCSTGPRPR